jgi:hypothetical protein
MVNELQDIFEGSKYRRDNFLGSFMPVTLALYEKKIPDNNNLENVLVQKLQK